MTLGNTQNLRSALEYIALAALLIAFFGYFAISVWDIDFWWHIAAGRNILESGAIPSVDPFGVYDANSVWGQTILKSQWLGQVILYSVFRQLDLDGIIYLRAGLLTACLALVYVRCRLAGTSGVFALPLIGLVGLAILHHTGERPQLFSFFYYSIIFLLLDAHVRYGKSSLLYLIPLVMLAWSNTHGGAVLGAVVLGLYGAGYVIKLRIASGRVFAAESLPILIAVALSIATLLIAPNGFTTFEHIIALESNPIRDRTSEYATPFEMGRVVTFYWVFLVIAIAALPGMFNKSSWNVAGLIVALAVISLTGFRYIPFFVLMAAPYVAASLQRMLGRYRRPEGIVSSSVLISALVFLGWGYKEHRVFQHGAMANRFPVNAVAFIKEKGFGGKTFTTMNWGGYLIWNLSPAITPYVDGRMLDPKRIVPYTHILWTTPEGVQFFEQEHFDLALLPYGNSFTGERYPLLNYLSQNQDWKQVYQDAIGYLFVRRN
jgi:hypothetical protein